MRRTAAWNSGAMLLGGVLAVGCVGAHEAARAYPAWRIADGQQRSVRCFEAWLSGRRAFKSGSAFVVTLQNRQPSACQVQLVSAELVLRERRVQAVDLPRSTFRLFQGNVVRIYLPFEYDAAAAWNDGDRVGTLRLGFAGAAQRTVTWHVELTPRDRRDEP